MPPSGPNIPHFRVLHHKIIFSEQTMVKFEYPTHHLTFKFAFQLLLTPLPQAIVANRQPSLHWPVASAERPFNRMKSCLFQIIFTACPPNYEKKFFATLKLQSTVQKLTTYDNIKTRIWVRASPQTYTFSWCGMIIVDTHVYIQRQLQSLEKSLMRS